jgi:hypothetical protein
MNTVILVQPTESAAWKILPGFYADFQSARDMIGLIRSSYSSGAFFAIEHADDVARKGYQVA